MWQDVLGRFEKHAPASVMARIALEQAMPAAWIDEVFEANRQRERESHIPSTWSAFRRVPVRL